MNWLVTAFEPFDKAESNSSMIVAEALAREDWSGRVHFHYPISVRFDRAWQEVEEALKGIPPVDGILALGQAESRARISLERVALNWIDARIADNAGVAPKEREIQPGPPVYWSNIAWNTFRLPESCELSYSAGTFVCNTLFFQIMDWAHKNARRGGFVHIPRLVSQTSLAPRMRDEAAVESLREVLKFLVGA